MISILRAVGMALLLALSGCSMAAITGLRALPRPDSPPSVVLKVETHRLGHHATVLSMEPTFLLLDDGRFIARGEGVGDVSGIQPYLVWRLSADGMAKVIELATDAGMMTDSSAFADLHPRSPVGGVQPTIFTLNVDGAQHIQEIWAIQSRIDLGPDDPRTPLRAGLTDLHNKLAHIGGWLERDMLDGPQPFVADRSLLFLTHQPHDPDGRPPSDEVKDWPLEPLSAMTNMDEGGDTKCVAAGSSTVRDIDRQIRAVVRDEEGKASQTHFISEGRKLSRPHARPLMPDESGCDSVSQFYER